MKTRSIVVGVVVLSLAGVAARAEVKVTIERNQEATSEFEFKTIPAPLKNDLGAKAKFAIVDGVSDPNAGGLPALNDGRLPDEGDQPARNFFFNAGDDGGRVQLDLGSITDVKQ